MADTANNDKKKGVNFGDWKVILVGMFVLILAFEMISMYFLGSNSVWSMFNTAKPAAQQYGNIEFNGSIRTYDPILVIPAGTLQIDQYPTIKSIPGVQEVSQESGNTVIRVETRDDVYPVAVELKKQNLTTYTIANIAAPTIVGIQYTNGTKGNVSLESVSLRVETQPVVPPDTTVSIVAVGLAQENKIVSFKNIMINSEEKNVTFNGTINSAAVSYTYQIQWEQRNSINVTDLQQKYDKVTYNKENVGVFDSDLNSLQMTMAKQTGYVQYIDKKSALFAENFTNKSLAEAAIGANMTVAPSVLVIVTNKTVVDIPFNATVKYRYLITLDQGQYTIPEVYRTTTLESDKKLNTTVVQVNIDGMFVGPVLLEVVSEQLAN